MGRTIVALGLVLFATGLVRAQDRTDGWVVLSVEDYRGLRARAFPQPPDPSPPPIDAALTRVDSSLRVGADAAAGEARLTIDVLKRGWTRVQMPAGLVVRNARLDGRPVALVPGSPPEIVLSQPGRVVLTLDVVVPITSTGTAETLALPSSGSAVAATTLTLPRAGVDFTASGGVIAERVETPGQTRWVVYGVPWQPLSFTWKRRADERRTNLPLRTRGRIAQLVALGEETSRVTAHVTTEVVEGTARDVVLAIPAGVAITQVSGANVADWEHQQETLRVSFLEPVTAQTSFVVHGESRLPRDGTVLIPIVRAAAAERETGGLDDDAEAELDGFGSRSRVREIGACCQRSAVWPPRRILSIRRRDRTP